MWQPYKDRGIHIFGISSESVSTIEQFVSEEGLTFPILQDPGKVVYSEYSLSGGISPYPRDFIIDGQGIIRYANTEYDYQTMVVILDGLLANSTDVRDENPILPSIFSLEQNFPNPFNATTRIHYDLPESEHVHLSVFDLLGREVNTLVNQLQSAGSYRQVWNGRNEQGLDMPSGVYIIHIEAGFLRDSRKMTLLR